MKKYKYSFIQTGYAKRRRRWLAVTLLMLAITLLLAGLQLNLGNTRYPLSVVMRVLLGESVQGATFAIGTIRLPRMLSGILAGVAFGVAGNTFQTMLRNPLASPDIIGVTSGSSVAAVFCLLVLKISGTVVSVAAVITGLCVAMFIYVLSKGGSFSGGRLILIGIGIQAMLSAVISFLLLRATEYDVPAAMRWLSGNLNGIQMKNIPWLFGAVVVFVTIIWALGRHLKILELGEQSAVTLGLKANQTRFFLIFSAVCLIAFATSVTGPVAFVAFLAGPIAGRLAGSGQSNVIPAGFTGAILVLAADLIGQYAFDTRFPVGIITGILGAPYLLYLLIHMNRTGGAA